LREVGEIHTVITIGYTSRLKNFVTNTYISTKKLIRLITKCGMFSLTTKKTLTKMNLNRHRCQLDDEYKTHHPIDSYRNYV
jgi:hypothetical protein